MSAARRRRRRSRGLTLVELVSTIAITAALGTGTSVIILEAVDGYADAATRAQMHAELSTALDRVVRELRAIPLDEGAAGIAPDVTSVTASSIAWGAGSSAAVSGGVLRLELDGGPARVLLEDVKSFAVRAYDESGVALATTLAGDGCDPIRRVEVSITQRRSGLEETLRARVFLRSTTAEGAS